MMVEMLPVTPAAMSFARQSDVPVENVLAMIDEDEKFCS